MTRDEASEILELSPHAGAAERSAQYDALRRQLEDKLAKAPTPGLREKYRTSLKQLEEAFTVLSQTDDSAALPVAQKQSAGGGAISPAASVPSGLRSQVSGLSPTTRRKSSGKEFALVAVIAVILLAGGGWFVLKTRAENAEKARIAAEQKAAADRQAEEARLAAEVKKKADEEEKIRVAAAEKAEQERREKLLASLRSRLAELNVTAEALFRDEPSKAARVLSDLKSDERSLGREAASSARNRAQARLAAQQAYVDQVDALLARHPAKLAQARAAELLSARQPDEAGTALDELSRHLQSLEQAFATARRQADQSLHGALAIEVDSQYGNVTWTLTDAFGDKQSGSGSRQIDRVAVGAGEIVFNRPGWPAQKTPLNVRAGTGNEVRAVFNAGMLQITSTPGGARFTLSNGTTGTTPATLQVVPGPVAVAMDLPGYQRITGNTNSVAGSLTTHHVDLTPLPLLSDSELSQFIGTLPTSNVASDVSYATWTPVRAVLPRAGDGRENVSVCLVTFRPVGIDILSGAPSVPAAWFERSPVYSDQTQANQRGVSLAGGLLGAIASSASQSAASSSPFARDGHGYVVLTALLDRGTLRWYARPKIEQTSNPALASACVDWLMNGVQFHYTGARSPFHVFVYIVVKYRNPSK